MNQLDDEIKAIKVKGMIISILVYGLIAYAMYTYVWPMLAPYILN